MSSSVKDANVLIVEDNPLDVTLIKMALARSGVGNRFEVATDGEDAISRLRVSGCEPISEHPYLVIPDLVILDLNLPKVPGAEVLQAIRGHDRLCDVTVVILSSSPGHVLAKSAEVLGATADCYLTKPPDVDAFLALGDAIRSCHEATLAKRVS